MIDAQEDKIKPDRVVVSRGGAVLVSRVVSSSEGRRVLVLHGEGRSCRCEVGVTRRRAYHGGAGRAKVEHVMVEPLLCSRGGTDRVVECVEVKLLLHDRDGAAVTWQWQCGINVVC
ncbi:hypothetical protein WN943_018895 [Citrus x changshan-huyou]